MDSDTALKVEYIQDYIEARKIPQVTPQVEWEVKRARIAKESEAACNLAGNNNSPDFEAFAEKYGFDKNSDFA